MAALRPSLEAPVLIGVGAAFDFHAGLVPQAPPLAAARRARMGLPSRPRTAAAVAPLLALQPSFRGRFRAPARRAPHKRRKVLNPPPVRLPGRDLKELLGDAVPHDHARQTLADRYIEREIGRRERTAVAGARPGLRHRRARSTSFALAIRTSSGWASTFQARRRPNSGRELTHGSRPSTGYRCLLPTARSSSCTASRCSSTCAIQSRFSPRSAGCSPPAAGSPARPPSSRHITR